MWSACNTEKLKLSRAQALERLKFQDLTLRQTLINQARVLAFFYYFTYSVLRSARPRFQPMEAP